MEEKELLEQEEKWEYDKVRKNKKKKCGVGNISANIGKYNLPHSKDTFFNYR